MGRAGILPAKDRADRVSEARPRAVLEAAGDEDEIVGARLQLVANIGDEVVEHAGPSHEARQRFARDRGRRGKDRRLHPAHPLAPAKLRRQIGEFGIEGVPGFGHG
jgi:hypothetical protein